MTPADPPDPYLQFLLKLFYGQLIKPSSSLYLPKLIEGQKNPTYEPYLVHCEWTIANDPSMITVGCAVCLATAPDEYADMMPDPLPAVELLAGSPQDGGPVCQIKNYMPTTPPTLTLADADKVDFTGKVPFKLAGLSNMTPEIPVVTSGEDVTVTAHFSEISDWIHADGIALDGNFTLLQDCCYSDDGTTCATGGQHWSNHGFGTFSALLKNAAATATATARIKVEAGKNILQATMNTITLQANSTPKDLAISAVVLSITDPKIRKSWEQTLQLALDSPKTRDSIVHQIGIKLNSADVRKDFENAINQALYNFCTQGITAMLETAPQELRQQAPDGFEDWFVTPV